MPIADAHIHLFNPGFVGAVSPRCRRVLPDEVTLYDEFTRLHDIEAALVIGYEGESWADGNNDYIAALAPHYSWLHPVAYVHDPATLTVESLENLAQQGFVGISLYLFKPAPDAAPDAATNMELDAPAVAEQGDQRLEQTDPAVWSWLTDHRWLISVNSSGAAWTNWLPILTSHPRLRLLISHLGLPPRPEATTSQDEAARALGPVVALARFPATCVKLSAFYALSDPGYAYPHTAAWPYIDGLLHEFGTDRLLLGSDFSPALEWVSFPQSIHLLDGIPALTENMRRAICHDNLMRLLQDATAPAFSPPGERNARKNIT